MASKVSEENLKTLFILSFLFSLMKKESGQTCSAWLSQHVDGSKQIYFRSFCFLLFFLLDQKEPKNHGKTIPARSSNFYDLLAEKH
ncbi:MAG: hypothetical protein O9353_06520 [Bacteroidia bacterium]|nr:hypothetical protein [Bacteroidia bacterium]